ncbi:MAG: hypothetical protein KAI02_05195 [Gammaproteobacteria bacterium]|nr:hypothetical protein [Gammaproteobacteria bacterium]
MKFAKYISLLLFILSIFIFIFLHFNTSLIKGNDAVYIGSERCAECHQREHQSWHDSQHPKIFKRFTNDAQIVADY